MPKQQKKSAKRSAGAFGSNHLLHVLNASEDHRISRIGALKALGVPKTRAALDRLSGVINVLEADSRLEKIRGHSIRLPCRPNSNRGAPTKFQSKFLGALEQAETQQLSRIGALKAMGLQRTRKNLDRLARAIDVLHVEGSVQKLGGHSVCLLSGDIKDGKRGRGDSGGGGGKANGNDSMVDDDMSIMNQVRENERVKKAKIKELTETLLELKTPQTGIHDENFYLEWIDREEKEENDNIVLQKISHMKLEKEVPFHPGVTFEQAKKISMWMVETMNNEELKISEVGNNFRSVRDIYNDVVNGGKEILNALLEKFIQDRKKHQKQVNFIQDRKEHQKQVDEIIRSIGVKEKEIEKLLLANKRNDGKEGPIEMNELSPEDKTTVQQANKTIGAKWQEVHEVTKNFVDRNKEEQEKKGANRQRLNMLESAEILVLTMPESKIRTLTLPAHKLVKIQHFKDKSGMDTMFRFSPPTTFRQEVEKAKALDENPTEMPAIQEEQKQAQTIVKELVEAKNDVDGTFKHWEAVTPFQINQKVQAAAESIDEKEKPFDFVIPDFAKCCLYRNIQQQIVIRVELNKATAIIV
jgi:hypothetical protein